MKSHNRFLAAVASMQRLLAEAGAEFDNATFQQSDADKMGLKSDFQRALDTQFIQFVAYPDWYEPTERGTLAAQTLNKISDALAKQKIKRVAKKTQ